MELNSLWEEMKRKQAEDVSGDIRMHASRARLNPLAKLRRALAWTTGFYLAGILAGMVAVFQYSAFSIRICLAILMIESGYAAWNMILRIREFDRFRTQLDQDLLNRLNTHLDLIRGTIGLIETRTILFLPFAYLTGLLIGGSSETIHADTLIRDHAFLLEGMGIALLTMPALYFFMKWTHKKTLGDHIAQIETMVNDLRSWDISDPQPSMTENDR